MSALPEDIASVAAIRQYNAKQGLTGIRALENYAQLNQTRLDGRAVIRVLFTSTEAEPAEVKPESQMLVSTLAHMTVWQALGRNLFNEQEKIVSTIFSRDEAGERTILNIIDPSVAARFKAAQEGVTPQVEGQVSLLAAGEYFNPDPLFPELYRFSTPIPQSMILHTERVAVSPAQNDLPPHKVSRFGVTRLPFR